MTEGMKTKVTEEGVRRVRRTPGRWQRGLTDGRRGKMEDMNTYCVEVEKTILTPRSSHAIHFSHRL